MLINSSAESDIVLTWEGSFGMIYSLKLFVAKASKVLHNFVFKIIMWKQFL